MARRPAHRGFDPPLQILLLGWTTWRESFEVVIKGRVRARPIARAECPNGCARRDLALERVAGVVRRCLRCHCHTADPEGWSVAIPLPTRKQERARAVEQKAAEISFAMRNHRGDRRGRAASARP